MLFKKITILFLVMTLRSGFNQGKNTDPLLSKSAYPPRRVSSGPFLDISLESPDLLKEEKSKKLQKFFNLLSCFCLPCCKKN